MNTIDSIKKIQQQRKLNLQQALEWCKSHEAQVGFFKHCVCVCFDDKSWGVGKDFQDAVLEAIKDQIRRGRGLNEQGKKTVY